jgi:hypothetical protein
MLSLRKGRVDMAKKWVPQVGESYIVRGSDNGKTGQYLGTIHVGKVHETPRMYYGDVKDVVYKDVVYDVTGTFLSRRGELSPSSTWSVGKAGLIKDIPRT